MKPISDDLDPILTLVRAADPLPGGESEPLDTEAQLRVLLANLPASEQPKHPRRRRPLVLGAIGMGAAAATVAVANLAPTGQASGPLGPTSSFVGQAEAAQIIAKVKQALAHYPPGEIVVSRQTETITRGTRVIGSWTYAQWTSTSFPYRDRFASFGTSEPSHEEGTTRHGVWQLYDPSRNTIYQRTPDPGYALTPGPHPGWWTITLPKAYLFTPGTPVPASDRGTTTITITNTRARALRRGLAEIMYTADPASTKAHEYGLKPKVQPAINVTGGTSSPLPAADWVKGLTTRGTHVTLDGRRAIEISRGPRDTMWFSAKTLAPLKEVYRYRGQTTTTRYTRYTVLKGTAASSKLLSVNEAHPSAKLVIGVAPLYAAAKRLGA